MLLLASAGSGACATSPAQPRPQASTAPARSAAQQPRPAPDYALGLQQVLAARDLDGALIGPAPAGKEATMLVVFASWCGPCRRELAILDELRAQEPRLRIIGLNAYEEYQDLSDEQRLRAFLSEAAPWLQVVHADTPLMDALGRPSKIPTLFVFDRNGSLVEAFLRSDRPPPDKAELEAVLGKVLAGEAMTGGVTGP